MIDLGTLIEQANDLAPLPATTVRLFELIRNPVCHLSDLAELIAFDQSLTLKLLRAANSAASASTTPVRDVKEAVMRMGTAQVLALAVACGTKRILQTQVPAYRMKEGALWRHSVAAAVAAETTPGFCTIEVPLETLTAALLHDVGKLVMGRFLSPEILAYLDRAREVDQLDQLEAESLLLSVNHAELGGLIAQHWNLPPRVIEAITHHHKPHMWLDVTADLTYVANIVAKNIEAGIDGQKMPATLDADVAERIGLTSDAFNELCPAAAKRFVQISHRYSAA